ncbi:MAG: hypothetical protein ABIE55_03595 [Candidatus Aenigmatarchaeota archaeon]
MKGIFYSIMTALMLIPILSLLLFYSENIQTGNIDVEIRANELDYFTESIERDLTRFVEINGKRSLISAVSKIVVNGTGLDNSQLRLKEMVENGTLYGESAPLVDTSNLQTWKSKIVEIAGRSGFNVDFQNIQIHINQSDSFNLLFNVNVSINVSDKIEIMGILKNITASALVSIEGVEDPTFPLNTYGRVVRFIRASNSSEYTNYLVEGTNSSGYASGDAFVINSSDLTTAYAEKILVTDTVAGKEAIAAIFKGVVSEGDTIIPPLLIGRAITGASGAREKIANNSKIYLDQNTKKVWDLGNLTSDIVNGFYHNSSVGASFLDRLEGKITLSPEYVYGLETFVYLPDLTAASVSVNTLASCVDYNYWNDIVGSEIRNSNYNPVYTWFKIDTQNAIGYGINDLIT